MDPGRNGRDLVSCSTADARTEGPKRRGAARKRVSSRAVDLNA
jgi:hypothetical protein